MERPRVTIVLLIKNNAEILEDLLTAIFSQEASFPFEVLAIDSGSLDGSLSILKRAKHALENQKSPLRYASKGQAKIPTLPRQTRLRGAGKIQNLGTPRQTRSGLYEDDLRFAKYRTVLGFARSLASARDDKKRDSGHSASWRGRDDRTLRICQIAPIEFGFGRTRNLAARLARGEMVVFISTRTIPADREWLSNLVESLSPFTRVPSGTVASFGKVIPGPKVGFSEAFRLRTFYGRAGKILSLQGKYWRCKAIPPSRWNTLTPGRRTERCTESMASMATGREMLFSDLNCAILRCVLRKYPFDENIVGGEEQVWARNILENGMSIAYNSHAGVIFLRGHTFGEIFRHYFSKGYTFAKNVSVSGLTVFWSWVGFLLHEALYLLKKQNLRLMVKEFIFELGRLLGYFLGQRADRLPTGIRERFLTR